MVDWAATERRMTRQLVSWHFRPQRLGCCSLLEWFTLVSGRVGYVATQGICLFMLAERSVFLVTCTAVPRSSLHGGFGSLVMRSRWRPGCVVICSSDALWQV